jgi:hypothetical protein
MTTLTWDKTGERVYQSGVDRGVLYLRDGTSAVWNGLTSIEEDSDTTLTSYYLDGVKYLDELAPGDFTGVLKAFTYPDEFDQVNGIAEVAPGLSYHDQPSQSFNLSYRTKIGNDSEGVDHAYKIHLLYNVIANPATFDFQSLKDSDNTPVEFQWNLTGTPPKITGNRPTVHVSIDSRKTDPEVLQGIEDVLYGTDSTAPHFPSFNELLSLFESLASLIIIDNGDGTWQAIDNGNNYITMISDTEFQIDGADATFIDASTYTISTTNPA